MTIFNAALKYAHFSLFILSVRCSVMEIETDNKEEIDVFTRSSATSQCRPQRNPRHAQRNRRPGGSRREASDVPDKPREVFEENKE
jgi:hypothetical protein